MIFKEQETHYILTLMKAVLNNEILMDIRVDHDWSFLYKVSEYHHVSAMVYYAVLGKKRGIPKEWKSRFSESFRKGVAYSEQQLRDLEEVGGILRKAQVSNLLLPPTGIKCMYPQADMRETDEIHIYFSHNDEKKLIQILTGVGIHFGGRDGDGNLYFITRRNFKFIFVHRLFPHNPKLRKYFARLWEMANEDPELPYLYYLSPENQYVLLISWICDKLIFGRVDVRDVADIHVFLRHYEGKLNWPYIELKLSELQISDFGKEMRHLGCAWFGSREEEQNQGVGYLDLEEYVLSKGMYGLEGCTKLIPIFQERKIRQLKQKKRERMRKLIRWLFPEQNYMQGIYKVLESMPFLLPVCWCFRLLHLLFYNIRTKLKKLYFRSYLGLCFLEDKIRSFVGIKVYEVSEEEREVNGFPEIEGEIPDEKGMGERE